MFSDYKLPIRRPYFYGQQQFNVVNKEQKTLRTRPTGSRLLAS
jgi:hypothetical protein